MYKTTGTASDTTISELHGIHHYVHHYVHRYVHQIVGEIMSAQEMYIPIRRVNGQSGDRMETYENGQSTVSLTISLDIIVYP